MPKADEGELTDLLGRDKTRGMTCMRTRDGKLSFWTAPQCRCRLAPVSYTHLDVYKRQDIVYEDKRIVVAVKPAGVVSVDQPGGMPELLRQTLHLSLIHI